MQKIKILIVGCGDVGTRLATRLIQNGHDVVGLRRSPPKDTLHKIPYFAADVSSVESLS
ncbi:MAG: NAD(P)-binding domain-containing protein, partial [Nitrospirae bacterium]|nr:NAD(P)-binding domain-containing protein [Candidatus Manganitrophaceae bacterium]